MEVYASSGATISPPSPKQPASEVEKMTNMARMRVCMVMAIGRSDLKSPLFGRMGYSCSNSEFGFVNGKFANGFKPVIENKVGKDSPSKPV